MTPINFRTQTDLATERGRIIPAGSTGSILKYCRNRNGVAHVWFDGMPPKETVLVMVRQLFAAKETKQ